MKSPKILLLAGVALVLILFGIQRCRYHFSYASDLQTRPWAYSADPKAKLLTAQWKGAFSDPDGVEKSLTLEIYPPMTEEERNQKANRRTRRRRGLGPHENKQAFEGIATVSSKLGTEEYEIDGAVEKADFHQLRLTFQPADEAKRILPNFTVFEGNKGQWQGDELKLTLSFVHHNADGTSSSSSEGVVVNGKLEWKESKEDRVSEITLKRAEP